MGAFSIRSSADRRIIRAELSRIHPSPHQARKQFDQGELRALADSIRQYGLLSPLLVRRVEDGFELIAGERRLRALHLLGRREAEVIVTAAFDQDCALMGLVENLQREELHFLDEAEACRRILQEHALSREELAAGLCKSPSALANLLRLLRLGREVRACIRSGGLSERHARALLRVPSEDAQLCLARRAAQEGLSVRQLEALIEQQTAPGRPVRRPAAPLFRDSRLVINALKDTVRQLKRIGVAASSRVEEHGDHYDVIVTIRTQGEALQKDAQ